MLDDFPTQLLVKIGASLILTIVAAAGAVLLYWWRLPVWERFNFHRTKLWFGLRCRLSRRGIRLVTLDDYVALLESLRESLLNVNTKQILGLKIYVLTMQLPRDWPLWASDVTVETLDKAALEHYFLNFAAFLKSAAKTKRTVDVKRIVVIENSTSPSGQRRLEDLRADVESPYYDDYINMLHSDEAQARYYARDRPWPGWLTDAVFYGVDTEQGAKWLWGVTTSYKAGEDLILLRFHRICRKEMSSRFTMPWGAKSLADLLKKIEEIETTPLSQFRPPAAPPAAPDAPAPQNVPPPSVPVPQMPVPASAPTQPAVPQPAVAAAGIASISPQPHSGGMTQIAPLLDPTTAMPAAEARRRSRRLKANPEDPA